MKRRWLSLLGGAAVIAFSGQAGAQSEPDRFSTGEFTQVFACFFECKPGRTAGRGFWEEITTVVVINANTDDTAAGGDDGRRVVNIKYVDANHNILGSSRGAGDPEVNDFGLDLSAGDLDEINICRTLENAKDSGLISAVPEIGIAELYIAAATPGAGAYAWVKNLLGRFFVNVDEPFDGRVTSIAKTECRMLPPEVVTPAQAAGAAIGSGTPQNIPIILIEGSDP